MRRTRVAVIGGGTSSEHEVSLASAASVADALDGDVYDVELLTIDRDGRWRSGSTHSGDLAWAVARLQQADVVFPALHGPGGEDGTVAALLDLMGVPYVGSGVRAGAIAMDKNLTKLIAAQSGIATAEGIVVTEGRATDPPRDFPVVVKPASAGSSHGVVRVDSADRLAAALAIAGRFDTAVLVEPLIEGREVDIAVLETPDGDLITGPPLEVPRGESGVFDSAAKYASVVPFVVPAVLDPAIADELITAARRLFRAIGCRGLARVDFFVTDAGRVILNEVNTMPGFTSSSQVPRIFRAAGMSYPSLLGHLVETALARRSPAS